MTIARNLPHVRKGAFALWRGERRDPISPTVPLRSPSWLLESAQRCLVLTSFCRSFGSRLRGHSISVIRLDRLADRARSLWWCGWLALRCYLRIADNPVVLR
jgi:hypothetical protein